MIRHIAVLTGKRGGFGAMKPMLRAIQANPDLRLSLIVTDQHVNPAFGATISEVVRDFPVAAAVDMEQADGSAQARSAALGVCLRKMSDVLADLAPDILVLYGDRGEVLATALAAIHLRIPIAHVQGGDISGNVDELMRHALTKLSHLHFPSNEQSASRIAAMGEEGWRIHVVGDNHVDEILAASYTDADTLRRRYDIAQGERPVIVLLHPETTRDRNSHADMTTVLDSVLNFGRRTLIVYPCSDHGFEGIVQAIEATQGRPGVSIHRNIDAPDFLGLMAIAGAMVGNSSAGLIETPYFGLPAVNIGERQTGRLAAENVLHAGLDGDAITAALKIALEDEKFRQTAAVCQRPYGDGRAGERIVDILARVPLGHELFNKRYEPAQTQPTHHSLRPLEKSGIRHVASEGSES